MSELENKIEAADTSIKKLLKDEKFYIDYFQREYRWEEGHMKTLIEDLTSTFLKSYTKGDKPQDVAHYQNYYLGPVVFSKDPKTGKKSIIDGQQRITSITLLLIYLNHLQKEFNEDQQVEISSLIFSVKHRIKSFNMTDPNREKCLKSLFEEGDYTIAEDDDETVQNMVHRYHDIHDVFPEEIDDETLPFFIDWFNENVVIVEITAYSNENAYTIFETMNDRGLNLTSTEMLKGYVLSKISDKQKRDEINEIWKQKMIELHDFSKTADQSFFHAWFRAKYATEMRPGNVGAENKDFELIGSRFHSWFKDNHETLFNLRTSDEFYSFFKNDFPFFVKWYLKSWQNRKVYNTEIPHLAYIESWGIAESLQEPMLLSSIEVNDTDDVIYAKFDLVARYIETYTVRRSLNNKKFGQAAIKYGVFNIIKLIRDNKLSELKLNLKSQIEKIPQEWNGVQTFRLNKMNRKFVKHLLSRISSYVDQLVGKDTTFVNYYQPKGKQYEIEHIWANKFDEHKDEFDQKDEFEIWRNSIGALILLPQGTNQSFSSDKYVDKIEHYLKENTFAQTLHSTYYQKNPNFLKSETIQELGFKAHQDFNKDDITERTSLVQRICEHIWSPKYYE